VSVGAFAQGSWGIGGNVEIGTRIDLDPDPMNPDGADALARVEGIAYNTEWDLPRGNLELRYNRDDVTIGLDFSTLWNGSAFFAFRGENFEAKAQVDGFEQFFAGAAGNANVARLWGKYKMLNGMVGMDIAYASEQGDFWTVGGYGPAWMVTDTLSGTVQSWGWREGLRHNDFFAAGGGGFTWQEEGWNWFRAYVDISNINFGIYVPSLFRLNGDSPPANDGTDPSFDPINQNQRLFVENVLKKSIFGVNFNLHPIEFASHFKLEDYGVYFGGKFNAGPVVFGISFQGDLNVSDNVNKNMVFGAGVNYNAGAFGVGLRGSITRDIDPIAVRDAYTQVIAIQPNMYYKIIPSHLGFALDTSFFFTDRKEDNESVDGQPDVIWAVQPQLVWNFNGTGAATGYEWWPPFTGMLFRYRMISTFNLPGQTDVQYAENFLDVVFRWSF